MFEVFEVFEVLKKLADIAPLGTFIALVFALIQIRNNNILRVNDARARLFMQVSDIRSLIAQHPEVREYIYEGIPIKNGNLEVNTERLIKTIAEMYANYLEHLAILYNEHDSKKFEAWSPDKFIRNICENSPIIKATIKEHREWYHSALYDIVSPPIKKHS